MQHLDLNDEDHFDHECGDKNDDVADKAMMTDEVGRVEEQSDVVVGADHWWSSGLAFKPHEQGFQTMSSS